MSEIHTINKIVEALDEHFSTDLEKMDIRKPFRKVCKIISEYQQEKIKEVEQE